jgi:hypothetical protein
MKNFFWILMVFLSIILISCSEDNTNSPNDSGVSGILPSTKGNYWIYENYTLDSIYTRISKTNTIDSIAVTGDTTRLGKTASIFSDYASISGGNYTKTGNDYYYNDKSRLYVHSDFITGNFPANISSFIKIDEQWMILADENDNDWTIMEQDLDTIKLGTFGITGKITMRGKKGTIKEFLISNETKQAQEYIISIGYAGKTSIQGLPITIDFSMKIYLYFVKGIGLVNSITQMNPVEIPLFGSLPGSITESNLIRYNVK